MDFEFDPAKNAENIQKHGINLADVECVLYDPFALTREDCDHEEQRFVTMGVDGFGRLLVVCFTYRSESVIRLISARKVEAAERRQYEG